MKNKKLEQLLKQKQEIEEQIKFIEQGKKKWEHVGGLWYVGVSGNVYNGNHSVKCAEYGLERPTQEQAEKARDKMRVFNRLLAYHDEFCADYEFDPNKMNFHIVYNKSKDKYSALYHSYHNYYCVVYFPEHIAKELVEKLNSGVVEL